MRPHRWVWYKGKLEVCMFCGCARRKPPAECGDDPRSDSLADMSIFS